MLPPFGFQRLFLCLPLVSFKRKTVNLGDPKPFASGRNNKRTSFEADVPRHSFSFIFFNVLRVRRTHNGAPAAFASSFVQIGTRTNSGIRIESWTETKMEIGTRIRIKNETGTDIEYGTRPGNKCGGRDQSQKCDWDRSRKRDRN
ncbi:hypothetical protein EVAR_74327_1 [Eumeta japonica]|uniref:Uncharacterized protein n=1 Tax=Eumeta variegata TaxID=151549 RepID=A0A4C1SFV3_EUMVA|nr:hypothetical protein EVAR_74327_1 [Eumeta japonica]